MIGLPNITRTTKLWIKGVQTKRTTLFFEALRKLEYQLVSDRVNIRIHLYPKSDFKKYIHEVNDTAE